MKVFSSSHFQIDDFFFFPFRSSYKSDGASSSEARRIRRRSISITPEIGDDIARLVVVNYASAFVHTKLAVLGADQC